MYSNFVLRANPSIQLHSLGCDLVVVVGHEGTHIDQPRKSTFAQTFEHARKHSQKTLDSRRPCATTCIIDARPKPHSPDHTIIYVAWVGGIKEFNDNRLGDVPFFCSNSVILCLLYPPPVTFSCTNCTEAACQILYNNLTLTIGATDGFALSNR